MIHSELVWGSCGEHRNIRCKSWDLLLASCLVVSGACVKTWHAKTHVATVYFVTQSDRDAAITCKFHRESNTGFSVFSRIKIKVKKINKIVTNNDLEGAQKRRRIKTKVKNTKKRKTEHQYKRS